MLLRFICVSLMVSAMLADEIQFEDCGKGEIKKIMVSGCDKTKCVIHRGKQMEVQVVFKANQNSKKAHVKIKATINGTEIVIPGIDNNACHYMHCPLTKGKETTYKYPWQVPKALPSSKDVSMKAQMIGDNGELNCVIAKHLQIAD